MNIFCIVSSGFVYPNLDLILKSLNTKLNDEIMDLICWQIFLTTKNTTESKILEERNRLNVQWLHKQNAIWTSIKKYTGRWKYWNTALNKCKIVGFLESNFYLDLDLR